jgi:hypothetical protein
LEEYDNHIVYIVYAIDRSIITKNLKCFENWEIRKSENKAQRQSGAWGERTQPASITHRSEI